MTTAAPAIKQVSVEEVHEAAAADVAPEKKTPARRTRRKRKTAAPAQAAQPGRADAPGEVEPSAAPAAPVAPVVSTEIAEPAAPVVSTEIAERPGIERRDSTTSGATEMPTPAADAVAQGVAARQTSATRTGEADRPHGDVPASGREPPMDPPLETPARRPRRRRRRRGGEARNVDPVEAAAGADGAEHGEAENRQPPPASTHDSHPALGSTVRESREAKEKQPPLARGTRRRSGGVAVNVRDEEHSVDRAVAARPEVRLDLLINVTVGDECRIAVVGNGRLEELFIERSASQSHVGNIYKGRVTNIEPSIQAAFIDFGLTQNGFLHISDVQPQYFPDHEGISEEVGRKIPRMHRPPIQNCFRRGQEVIVQVIKEGVGTKGPTLTTYLSIPGRYLVMMPGMSRHGVSRKIEDDAERRTMRDLLRELKLPSGMGFILRTAGMGRTKREVQRDLTYLTRLWKIVADRIKHQPAPAELYQESDLVTRTIRDVFTTDFRRIVVDSPDTAGKIRDFLNVALPRTKVQIDVYSDREPLFHRFRLEEEIERINQRQVPLPSGGSLVIDSTEALVAIDVNSGRSRGTDDAEEMAYNTNMEAAEEIARQLRLRDLGGLIVCDFIDMRADRHKRGVERALRDALKMHKERARILRMSGFGLIEMTRQRQGPSIKRNLFYDCPHCNGAGLVKMPDSVILDAMRIIQLAINHPHVERVTVTVSHEVAYQILNVRRTTLATIEEETGKRVIVRGDTTFTSDQVNYLCEDGRGQLVNVLPVPALTRRGRRP